MLGCLVVPWDLIATNLRPFYFNFNISRKNALREGIVFWIEDSKKYLQDYKIYFPENQNAII
jgi:hypothetical protein